jgi:Tol biopolymer transport system component
MQQGIHFRAIFLVTAFSLSACFNNGSGGHHSGGGFKGLLYLVGDETHHRGELFFAQRDGSGLRSIDGGLTTNGNVTNFQISPDKTMVAYTKNEVNAGPSSLYVASLENEQSPVKVTGTINGIVGIIFFNWAPDSSRLAYVADQDTPGILDFYSVLPDGTGDVKLNGPQNTNSFAPFVVWAPDSSRVAYLAGDEKSPIFQLYSVFPDGTGNIKVSGTPHSLPGVSSFSWSNDSSRIAYVSDQDTEDVYELFTAFPDGTGNVKINDPIAGDWDIINFQWAPDSSRTLYIARQAANGTFDLHTVFPDGTGHVHIDGPLETIGAVLLAQWAPDSSRIAYTAKGESGLFDELVTVTPDRTGGTGIDDRLINDGDIPFFLWAPDSSRIAYIADHDVDHVPELYAAVPDSSKSQNINLSPVAGPGVDFKTIQWAPDSSRISYSANQDSADVVELYTVFPDGTHGVKVNGVLVPGGEVSEFPVFQWAPDSSRIAYVADQDSAGVEELYTVNPDGSGNVKVNEAASADEDLFSFSW